MFDRIREELFRGVDPASLVAFRVVYGGMAAISAARFFWYGWIDRFFYRREVFFHFPGFEWVRPLPSPGMEIVFGVLIVAGIGIAAGALYRVSLGAFVVGFTYVGLIDTTNYLNHYWFFRFLGVLMLFMPLADYGSVDAAVESRREGDSAEAVPAWTVWTLRLQIGLLYFFAGVAKLQWDWLVRGQPLEIWLKARAHLPVVGPYLTLDWLPNAMAVAGALFDLTVVFFLLNRRARPFAYAAIVGFHAATGLLFQIGMFPVIMIGLTSIFFEPDWPRRALPDALLEWCGLGRAEEGAGASPGSVGTAEGHRWLVGGLALWFAVQIALPLRHFLYPGDVSWTQEGFRLAWRVKIAERGGSLSYRVRNPETGRQEIVHPTRYLTRRQNELASADPAKILQLAHYIAEQYREQGWSEVEVRADAFVSLNGRRSRRLVDPEVDLAAQSRTLAPKPWILRWEETEPRRIVEDPE